MLTIPVASQDQRRCASPLHDGKATIWSILGERAASTPTQTAYRALLPDALDGPLAQLSYDELFCRASCTAQALVAGGYAGSRVLLCVESSLDYVVALFGILGAASAAVPTFPPSNGKTRERLAYIASMAQPLLVIADARWRRYITDLLDDVPVVTTEELEADGPSNKAASRPLPESVGLVQFTSGTICSPKGVIVPHSSIISNAAGIHAQLSPRLDRLGCSWLPPYHDMGLMGFVLQAVYSGSPLILMSPRQFVQSPYRWLKMISDHRATTTGASLSALELSMHRVDRAMCRTLDLGCLSDFFCGAELLRDDVLQRFLCHFAAAGLKPEALVPCYGSAEATLYVSGARTGSGRRLFRLDQSGIEAGEVRAAQAGGAAFEIVSSGIVAGSLEVAIIDPQSLEHRRAGEIGEIWISGPSVAAGYIGATTTSPASFDVAPAGEETRRFFRTGDLGGFAGGELIVFGRISDLISSCNRLLLPDQIEQTIRNTTPLLRSAAVAALNGTCDGLVIVIEIQRSRSKEVILDELASAVAARVVERHRIAVERLVIVNSGFIPTTTSGKIRRIECRRILLSEAGADQSAVYVDTSFTPNANG